MVQFEKYESVFIHLQSRRRQVCHSKAGTNPNVTLIDTFYEAETEGKFKLTVIDLENQCLLPFEIELDYLTRKSHTSYLGLFELPEEVEDLVDASIKRMTLKIKNNQKLRERQLQEILKHEEDRRPTGINKDNWDGFFVEAATANEPDLDNKLALDKGFATQEIIDHLKSLGLGFRYYERVGLKAKKRR